MAEPINLRRARKARDRAEAKAQADENAVRHGRTKAERRAAAAEHERTVRHLDGARMERDERGD